MSRQYDHYALTEPSRWYAHSVDTRDFSKLPQIFAPDARLIVATPEPEAPPIFRFEGLAQLSAALQTITRYPKTFHMLGQHLVLEYSGDTARTETYCRALHFYPRNGIQYEYIMYIRYLDTLRKKTDEAWEFTERYLVVDAESGVALMPEL